MNCSRYPVSVAFLICLAGLARKAAAVESIEFVGEHLPEIAMDNRYAGLPIWAVCDDEVNDDEGERGDNRNPEYCVGANAALARTHSGRLSIDGPMLAMSIARPIYQRFRITGFVFFDDLSLGSNGIEHRPMATTFANPPLSLPASADFTGLDGKARDIGAGFAISGDAEWGRLPRFEWSTGLTWQRLALTDYLLNYRIVDGPDSGTTGTLDYSAVYRHITPFLGVAWPRQHGDWRYSPHLQVAMPLPRRGVQGRITGAGFDITGNAADRGAGKHFGDPSVTIGFDVTYAPWHLTVDLGSAITQALIEPRTHEGVKQNLVLSVGWTL